MNNRANTDNTPTASDVRRRLQENIPAAWQLRLEERRSGRGPDAVLDLEAPDGRTVTILVDIKRRLDPANVPRVVEEMRAWSAGPAAPGPAVAYLVAAQYLGERVREKLRTGGLNYLDLTGNTWVSIDDPGIYVSAQGANKDPNPASRPTRSLRGAKAAQVVRALVDTRPPCRCAPDRQDRPVPIPATCPACLICSSARIWCGAAPAGGYKKCCGTTS